MNRLAAKNRVVTIRVHSIEFQPHSRPAPHTHTHIYARAQNKHSGVRPWSEFFNIRNVSRPNGSGDAVKRLLSNVSRFQSNYLFVFLGLVIYCM